MGGGGVEGRGGCGGEGVGGDCFNDDETLLAVSSKLVQLTLSLGLTRCLFKKN